MTHSLRKSKNKESKRKELKKRVIALQVLAKKLDVEMIKLNYTSLGELRKKWKQSPTDLPKEVEERVAEFRRIEIPRGGKRLVIKGSDDGLLVYCTNINDEEMMKR